VRVASEWVQYQRVQDIPAEAMRAHFTSHVYHRHSHETYSIGVTETGAQTFTCRHATHVSAAGQVMVFNPDDPHDGHAGDRHGFVYRMVHIQPEYLTELLPGNRTPLFRSPVVDDPALAIAVTRLHTILTEPATSLARYEALAGTARLLLRHASGARDAAPPKAPGPAAARLRDLIHDAGPAAKLSIEDLAMAAGRSRYTVYRAFVSAYGLSPSEYQRQLRLSSARRLLADGVAPADAAAAAGFADQAHLTRWFRRCYGITPAVYQSSSV
jgi:AraC-like DNA-binding protein